MHTDTGETLSDPKILAALYKAHLPANQAGLAALDRALQEVHTVAARPEPVYEPPPATAESPPPPQQQDPHGDPHGAFFTRGDFEYRLVPGTVSTYEYNRVKPKQAGQPVGPTFAEGGVADGYILLAENGGFARTPVSYAVLDEHIRRDLRLIGHTFDIPVPSRDYAYYEAAEKALAAVDRIWVSNDEKTIEVVSGGRRWRIALPPGFRVFDRADRMLFPFADVSAPGRLYRGVEITVDSSKREVVLFDRESSIGRIASIPYQDLSDVTTSRGPVFERESAPASSQPESGSAHASADAPEAPGVSSQLAASLTSEPAFQGVPGDGKIALKKSPVPGAQTGVPTAAAHVPSAAEIAAAVEKDHEAGTPVAVRIATPEEVAQVPPPQKPEEAARIPSTYEAGKMKVVSEITRDDSSIERIFELPYGKATVVARYSANDQIQSIDVRSNDFIYPAAEMVDGWESVLLRKRRSVGQFTKSDEEEDLIAAKRIIVQRARERMIYRTVLESLDDASPEYRAAADRMKEIGREVTERFGNIFTPHG